MRKKCVEKKRKRRNDEKKERIRKMAYEHGEDYNERSI